MGQLRQGQGLRRLLGGVTTAAVLVGACPAQAESCWVITDSITRVSYSDRFQLNAYLLNGSFSSEAGSRAPFSVLDDDGFLSLSLMMVVWHGNGRVETNARSAVPFMAEEVELLVAVIDLGEEYQQALLETLDDTPIAQRDAGHAANVADAVQRQAFMRNLGRQVRSFRNAAAGGGDVQVPARFLNDQIGVYLNRFAPGATSRLLAQYTDGLSSHRQARVLCDTAAESVLIGPVACALDFVTGAIRDPSFCSEGLVVAPLWLARSCRGEISGQTVSQSDCTANFSGNS